jgi:hypothetical protein
MNLREFVKFIPIAYSHAAQTHPPSELPRRPDTDMGNKVIVVSYFRFRPDNAKRAEVIPVAYYR